MPRALRLEYPGAIYHVMNRGDRREAEMDCDGIAPGHLDACGAPVAECE